VIKHEHYKKTNDRNGDIALIKLENEVEFQNIKHIRTICLPVKPEQAIENLKFDSDNDKTMLIAGWGQTEEKPSSDVLLFAQFTYLNNDECVAKVYDTARRHREFKMIVLESHMVIPLNHPLSKFCNKKNY
jgi:hypothetical protein